LNVINKCALHQHSNFSLSGEGPAPSDIMIIGMCPGPSEMKEGKLFVGSAGIILNDILKEVGLERSKVFITNIVKCFVAPGKTISKTLIRICRDEYLYEEIQKVKPKVIITLGAYAYRVVGNRYIPNSYFYSDSLKCYIVSTHHPAKLLYTNDDKIRKEIKDSFIQAINLLHTKKSKVEIGEPIVIDIDIDTPHFKSYLNMLRDPIALDTETTNLNFLEDDLISIGLSDGITNIGINVYSKESHPNFTILKEFLKTKRVVTHHGKFDYKFLKKVGIELNIIFDTMLAHFLIDRTSPHGLEELSLHYLHTKLTKGTIDFEKGDIDTSYRAKYCANDAWMTYKLYEIFKGYIDKQFPLVYYKIMIPTLIWLAEAEYRGVRVDREYIESYMNSLKYRLKSLEQSIQDDPVVKQFCSIYQLNSLNIKSPKQLHDLLYSHLKLESKDKNTSESTLEYLLSKHPKYKFLQYIVEYRHVYKSYRTYLKNLLKFSEIDGRIHCVYNQSRVPSGRLLSCLPFYTRLVTDKGIKEIYKIAPGDKVLTPYGYKEVLNILNTGQKVMYKIYTNKNTFECSANHQWLTPVGWKKTTELTTSDYLLGTRTIYERGENLIGDRFAYFLGVLIGDGHLDYNKKYNKYYKVVISYDTKYDTHIDYIKKLFPGAKSYYQKGRSKILCINNKKLCQWLAKLQFDVKHTRAFVPPVIFKSNLNVIKNFIAGYFDTDGGVVGGYKHMIEHSNHIIYFASASYQLLTDIQELLNILGISSRISSRSTNLNHKKFEGYKLTIYALEDIRIFFNLIPIKNKRKKDKIKKILSTARESNYALIVPKPSIKQNLVTTKYSTYYKLTSNGIKSIKAIHKEIVKAEPLNPRYFKIKKIERVKRKVSMYDLEVKEVHQYIVGGAICHNSQNPNLQNIPKSGELATMVRKAFIATDGYVLLEAV